MVVYSGAYLGAYLGLYLGLYLGVYLGANLGAYQGYIWVLTEKGEDGEENIPILCDRQNVLGEQKFTILTGVQGQHPWLLWRQAAKKCKFLLVHL